MRGDNNRRLRKERTKIDKPKVLGVVEAQTHKTYGVREGGKHRIECPRNPLPPIFANMGICWACGKERHVNSCGFCEECWITFAHGKARLSGGSP